MKITILFFGMARDIVGTGQLIVSDEKLSTVADCRTYLLKHYQNFEALKSFSVALNESYAEDAETLSEGDVVAIIPPVSGG